MVFRVFFSLPLLVPALAIYAPPVRSAPPVVTDLAELVPSDARAFANLSPKRLDATAEAIERRAAELTWSQGATQDDRFVRVQQLLALQRDVDRSLDHCLALRTEFAGIGVQRRAALRAYLAATSRLMDLSGRLRYALRDALDRVTYDLDAEPDRMVTLLDQLKDQRMPPLDLFAYVLFDPPAETDLPPFPPSVRRAFLDLVRAAPSDTVLLDLTDWIRSPARTPRDVIVGLEVMEHVGIPQPLRPDHDASLPEPVVTPAELLSLLKARPLPSGEDASWIARREALLRRLGDRVERGITGDQFRVQGIDLEPGDWLLMRNPSPYNRFTDLSPGLFTHVGVVTTKTGRDGIRRFVIVDLPERGDSIPATCVDAYLKRTLHYAFLRHRDPGVRREMARVAASLIGRPSQFDLTFRTSRVRAVRGKLQEQPVIHTYCAGFLLLCAQETSAPVSEFFPITEGPAGGRCADNLRSIGISFGEDFVSPTGALFSPAMMLVGYRWPQYTPDREIKESIYDYFADQMTRQPLRLSPTLYQTLRIRLGALAKERPWLARALARIHDVNDRMDLESAAKAASVIETLDAIADEHMASFLAAWQAIRLDPSVSLDQLPPEQARRIVSQRRSHEDLVQQWSRGELTPWELRVALVQEAIEKGRQSVDDHFFRATE